jgi:HSP20 family protein
MTLVKFNRGGRNNGSLTPGNNNSNGLQWPELFNNFTRPFFPADLIQDFFDDTMNLQNGFIGTTLPAVNIVENDNELLIEVAAPGMRKQDFKLEANDNQLHISYRKKEEQEEQSKRNEWRREFSFESFDRSFTLPAIVEQDKIMATYQDGILKIAIPKKEEARKKPARAIEVK